MSYILDALKKSEQDRGNGAIPNVQTIHSSSLNYHQESRVLWPWILAIILITNVSILIYFLKPDSTNNTRMEVAEVIIKKEMVMPTQEVISAPITPATPVHIERVIETSSADNNAEEIISIDELPANIRQQIPIMTFSAHVYSSNAIQRSLVINNRFMEEGDTVGQDLILLEITANGAIFDFRGQRFETSVLSGWGTP